MASYNTTVVVTCASAAEWTAFKAHLAAHGWVADVSGIPGYDDVDVDDATYTATLHRNDTVDVSQLS